MQKIQAMAHKKCCLSSKFQIQASGSHIQRQNLSAVHKVKKEKKKIIKLNYWGWRMKTKTKEGTYCSNCSDC